MRLVGFHFWISNYCRFVPWYCCRSWPVTSQDGNFSRLSKFLCCVTNSMTLSAPLVQQCVLCALWLCTTKSPRFSTAESNFWQYPIKYCGVQENGTSSLQIPLEITHSDILAFHIIKLLKQFIKLSLRYSKIKKK